MRRRRKFRSEDTGATAVEYALILAFLVAVIAVSVSMLVSPLGTLFQGPTDAINNAGIPSG